MKQFVFVITCLIFPCLLSAQSITGTQSRDSFKDPRDGRTYKTVKIGSQVWMAENLNFDAGNGSYCYDSNSTNCGKYGRLYSWEAAKKAVPAGWHLPSKEEFELLLKFLGGDEKTRYQELIEGGASKFNVMLGGWRYYGDFYDIGSLAVFWCSTEGSQLGASAKDAWGLGVYTRGTKALLGGYGKEEGAVCVRCVKD